MRPGEDYRNGDARSSGGSADDSGASDDSGGEEEYVAVDAGAPARALTALNALRKSRQHYDVVLVAGGGAGGEVPAHRALLAAHSPYLLRKLAEIPSAPAPANTTSPAASAPAALRVEAVTPDALRQLVEYAYTGRLSARDASGARALYRAAWRLRIDAAREALAERLLRRPQPADCLELRALPDLPKQHLEALDAYIAENFDSVCSSGALATLPLIRMEVLRAAGAAEPPLAVAAAALDWLRDRACAATLPELCSRPHLLFVAADGTLRDCGELPATAGDAPELDQYRREAAGRRTPAPGPAGPAGRPRDEEAAELGTRTARPDCAVLAARATDNNGSGRVTRALLVVRGALAAARVSSSAAARGCQAAEDSARRAALPAGRCALGVGALGGRLVVCGGYDRARVLPLAAAYDPATNRWEALPAMRGPRARFPAARLAGKLYVLGGSDGHNELDSVDVYEEDASGIGIWSGVARLPLAVSHAAAAALQPAQADQADQPAEADQSAEQAQPGGPDADGAVFVVGGLAAGRPLRSVFKYSPKENVWTHAPQLNTSRSQCASAVWAGCVWALGGCDQWHCLAGTERLPLGEPGAAWQTGPPLPTGRRSAGAAVFRGRLAAAGGSDGANSLKDTLWLEPGAAAWRAGPPLRRPRAALALAVLQDVLYAVGGFDGKEFLSCVECLYEPDGEWTSLTAPPAPRLPPTPGAPGAPTPPTPTLGAPATPGTPGTNSPEGAPPVLVAENKEDKVAEPVAAQ